MEKAARKACMVGRYQEGVSILADLFVEAADPTYIYNQARCLQQNHRWQEALDSFREYIRKAINLSQSDLSQIEDHIRECEAHLRIESAPAPSAPAPAAPAPAPAPPPPAPAPVPVYQAPVAPPPSSPRQPARPVEDPDRGQGLRIGGIITGTVGLVGLGIGVFCSAKTHDVASNDELTSYKTLGITSYAVGGVALATGVTLSLVGWGMEGSSDGHAVSIAPAIGPGMTAIVASGRF